MPMLARAGESDQHYELRMPCCPSCKDPNKACTMGELSGWLVVWPEANGVIQDGHAKGWKIHSIGSIISLQPPGSDGLTLEFEPN